MGLRISEEDVLNNKDYIMIKEENRIKSFVKWDLNAFKGTKCDSKTMASAGFYHCNIEGEDDGVRCFCCFKEFEGWEPSDDPWIEHNRNNNCYFANLGKPEPQLTVKELFKVLEDRDTNLLMKKTHMWKTKESKELNEMGLKTD